jgi:hypothetical protein
MDAEKKTVLKRIIVNAILEQAHEDAERIFMEGSAALLPPKRRRKLEAESERFMRELESL